MMNRLIYLPQELRETVQQKCFLKVISGLNNFNHASIEKIAWAAGEGGADLLDVACDPDIVRLALKVSHLPVCVSSVEPEAFEAALDAGASMIEIGNFDSFYPKGRFFNAEEVLQLASKTRQLFSKVPLSVTVPHILPLDQQAQLALDLVAIGTDFIQTEGGTSAKPISSGVLGLMEKAAPTLAATYEIKKTLDEADKSIPIISASGLSAVTVPMAMSCGASGVGVGSVVNLAKDEVAMLAVVRRLRSSIANYKKCLSEL